MAYVWRTCGCNRMAPPATLRVKELSCCKRSSLGVSFHGKAISIGQRDPATCDRVIFFLWRLAKSKVLENNPQTIPQLKKEIQRVIYEIDLELCANVI